MAKDLGPFLATAGLGGLSSGNGRNQAQAMTKLINATGGFAGHDIVPVIFEYDATGSSKSTQVQAACELFFSDHDAVAVLSEFPDPILQQCTKNNGVPLTVSLQNTLTAEEFAANPHVTIPDQLERGRGIEALISGLAKQRYFEPSVAEAVTVGLLTVDTPGYGAVPDQVRAALGRQGVKLAAVATINKDNAQGSASAAVLQLRAAGVNHVIFVEDNGGAATLFLLNANSQQYYPRLGLSSYDLPQIMALVLPPESFKDAVGIGWLPTFDVILSESDQNLNKPARTCMAALEKQGEDMDNSGSRAWGLGICDAALVTQASWSGRDLTLGSFQQGLRAVGKGYVSPMAPFGVDLSSRPDGVTHVRPLGFQASCGCFHYTGPVYRP